MSASSGLHDDPLSRHTDHAALGLPAIGGRVVTAGYEITNSTAGMTAMDERVRCLAIIETEFERWTVSALKDRPEAEAVRRALSDINNAVEEGEAAL